MQKDLLLNNVRILIKERSRVKEAEEITFQEKIRMMGKCPLNFDWLQVTGGWKCAGGSHYMSDDIFL